MIQDTQSAQISQKQEMGVIYMLSGKQCAPPIPHRLSHQWLCGNSCTWAHDIQLHIAGTNEPKSAQQAKLS